MFVSLLCMGTMQPIAGPFVNPFVLDLYSEHVPSHVRLHSDGTLNPNGVRFGSSEIYNIGEPACSKPVLLLTH